MKCLRYRRPALKIIVGITKAKKRIKKELGITDALKPFRAWTNAKRRFKRKVANESEAGRLTRNGLPRLGGCSALVAGAVMTAAQVAKIARELQMI